MPITTALGEKRSLGTSRGTLQYIIKGTSDEADARSALSAAAAATLDGLVLQDVDVEWIGPGAGGTWDGTATYGKAEIAQSDTGETILSIDMQAETIHLTHALEHVGDVALAAALTSAPDQKRAINVDEDGKVQGVDVPRPAMSFEVTYYKDNANVTWAYIQSIYALIGSINAAAVTLTASGITMAYAPRELLLLGASASPRGTKDWAFTLKFAASPNRTAVPLPGDAGATINKKGWEYLWVYSGEIEDTASGQRSTRPLGGYVERVHELGDFSVI
jgi:hypothetical protein